MRPWLPLALLIPPYAHVLYDDNVALTQGYACSRQYKDEADTLGKTGLAVWLKSKVCGIGQWIGLAGCRGPRR